MERRGISWPGALIVAAAVAVLGVCGYLLAGWPPESPTGATTEASGTPSPAPEDEDGATSVLWVGDSYAAGFGANPAAPTGPHPEGAESCLTADRMGWVCNLDAAGSTGFLPDSSDAAPALIGRLPATKAQYLADVVVIDAGRNDGPASPELATAIRRYVAAVRDAYPDAELVAVAPYWVGSKMTADPRVAELLRDALRPHDGAVIDPVSDGWMSAAVRDDLAAEDGVHPSPEGHAYIAQHLATELRRLGVGD